MTAIVVLNIVFSAFVIVGVLSLLAWGILADHGDRTRPSGARGHRTARAARPSAARVGRTVRIGA